MSEERLKTYKEFWPFYLREHSRPETRLLHYVGTTLGLLVLASAISQGRGELVLLGLFCGYFFAWISHFLIEKNRPATFKYPLWSFISDFRMLFCLLTGQIKEELRKANTTADF